MARGRRLFGGGERHLEALAQATGLLAFKTADAIRSDEALYYLAGIDNARFKKPVEPGDQLKLEVKLIKNKRKNAANLKKTL